MLPIFYKSALKAVLLLLFAIAMRTNTAAAQEARYTFVVRHVPLELALKTFASETSNNVTFLSSIDASHKVYCVLEDALPEDILTCLLQDTDLDYITLSSGTIAILPATKVEATYGTVTGHVVSSTSQASVAYAHVLIHELAYGVTTNEAGQFVLPPLLPGTYNLSASHIGYRTWHDTLQVTANQSHVVSIPLFPTSIDLEPIVIDGLKFSRPSEQLMHEKIDASELAGSNLSYGALNVIQGLNQLQGVQFSQATSDLHIQGGAAGDHQIRLDGSPIFLPQQLGGFWGPFNPLAIDQIRIYKSGFGVKLGSFQSGVMEANHRLHPAQGKHLTVHLAPATLSTIGSISPKLKQGKQLSFMAALRKDLWPLYTPGSIRNALQSWSARDAFLIEAPLYIGGALEPGSSLPFENIGQTIQPDLSFSDLHTAAHFQFSPLSKVSASLYNGTIGITNLTQATDLNVFDAYQWRNTAGQVQFETILGPRTLMEARLRSSRFALDHTYELIDQLDILANQNLPEFQNLIERPVNDLNRISESALQTDFTYAYSAYHNLQAGAELILTRSRFQLVASHTLSLIDQVLSDPVDSLAARTRQFSDNTRSFRGAIYLEDEWRVNNRLTLFTGLRWSWITGHNRSFAEPRISLAFNNDSSAGLSWSWRLAAGLYHQFITQHDLGTANLGAILPSLRFWLPVQAGTHPPKSIHFAANTQLNWGGLTGRAETYLRVQPRALALKQLPSPNFFDETQPINETPASFFEDAQGYATGLSVSLKKSISKIDLSAIVDWNRAKRRSASYFNNRNIDAPWIQPFRINFNASWHPARALSLRLNWQLIGRKPWAFRKIYYDNLGSGTQSSLFPPFDLSKPSSHQIPTYRQTDIGLTYRRPGAFPIQVDAGILNVFKRRHVADWRLQYNTVTGEFDKTERTAIPEFSPYVRMSLSW